MRSEGCALPALLGGLVGLPVLVVAVLNWPIVVAVLLTVLLVAGIVAVTLGALVLTWLYARSVHAVLFAGGHPEEPSPGPGEDPAHRSYHGGPAWSDLRAVIGGTWRVSAPWTLLLAPHLALYAGAVAVHQCAAWVCVGALRAADTALLVVRRVRMVCPHCFRRLGYPAYACECGRCHTAIRPGRRGIWRRVCLCAARMPTLLLFGTADLHTVCPYCTHTLEHRPGEAPELVLPLFGGAGAGKTRLVNGLYRALEQGAEPVPDAYADTVGEGARQWLGEARTVLRPSTRTVPTLPGHPVRGLTVRVGAGGSTLLLQLYDAAGERFTRASTVGELGYLGQATTFLLVVDPLGIDAVWRPLGPAERGKLAPVRSRTRDPELAYTQVLEEVERRVGAAVRRARLGVVVTRGDLLRDTSIAPEGPGQDALVYWAEHTLGLGNLLRSARAHFGRVRVFHTCAVSRPNGEVDPSVSHLLRWVLEGRPPAFGALVEAPELLDGAV
ncbi:TRAFAC clade GTPase domain-containing protein [Nocardiopsis xinjiangensis]|uniref:TRAFAC clade GTPase domain-containing protein n=1 Tax=Nocardiopsis xinjiangensis TaxID=124285 RepID=UPI0003452861|nr:hypothetical protein [Nocardiopsis xinjiangensis]